MPETFAGCLVAEGGTVRDAMRALDMGASRIALAVDPDGRLTGVATDGDIRRALLGGISLDDPVGPILNRQFVALRPGQARANVLELMQARHVNAIPIVDDAGRPVGLHLLHAFLAAAPRPNWAVIMAGGRGQRLRPLTDSVPKPMLRVAGRPILERIVLHVAGAGIERVFLSINYGGGIIEQHFGDGSAFGCSIEYLREDEPLGTAGALSLLPEAPREPLLVLNGDLVTNIDIGAMLEFHGDGGHDATIGTRRYHHTVPFGCVETDGDRVVGLFEKPTLSRLVNTGIYVLEPAVQQRVPRGIPVTMPEVIEGLLTDGWRVGSYEVEGDWIDVGQRDQLDLAREGA
jgi:dTDP-glucose pyrophosphorylase